MGILRLRKIDLPRALKFFVAARILASMLASCKTYNNSIYDFLQSAPQVIFIRDVDGNTPIDAAHDCRASQKYEDYGPKFERATIV